MPVFSKEIYVSRHYGNNFTYCGETIQTACKVIGLAIARAQWNDTIYIDGTGTSRDPYPCLATTLHTGGLYVNKSLSLKKLGDAEVFLNCSSSRQIVFDGSNAVSETVIIQLTGLTLFNSSVTARNCSLFVSRCLFTKAMSFPNATAVVNFEALQEDLSLTIQKSVFTNNAFSCIRVVGISPRIEVHNTAFVSNNATWESLEMVDVAIFMVLLTREHKEYALSMRLTNTSFIYNVAPFGGCLHIQTIPVNSGNMQTVKGHQKNRAAIQKDLSIISQPNSTGYVKRQFTRGSISLYIRETTFRHNAGRAITVNRDVSMINITITKSDFINNSSPLLGGAMLVESIDAFFLQIEDCKFFENSARNEGSAIYVIAVTLDSGSAVIRNALFMRNVLHNPDFIEDVPMGGTLALYVQQGHLKVHLENVSFMNNRVAMGSSTLYAEGFFLELTITECTFRANSQNERFTYDWKTISVDSYQLHFTLIDTIISENEANEADNETLEGQSVHVRVEAFDLARINMSGLHYKNNKGGGMYVQLGLNERANSTYSLQDSHFENNELFSMEIKAKANAFLQIRRVFFTANEFSVTDSGLGSLALFFLHTTAQGNQIAMEDTIFENNTVQGTILMFRLPPDERDLRACTIPKWNYGNLIRFIKVAFQRNNPDTSVMRLENGHNTLRNCQFVDNFAAYAIFIAESSTSLELLNTSFKHTQYWKMETTSLPYSKLMISAAFRGFIYYASSGPINLKDATLTVDTTQDIDAYVMVTGSSTAHLDNSSVIQCPLGTLRSWTKFSHTHVVSNNACPNGLYNAMSQSFIISCKACSTGFYSVKPFAEKCLPCPFGGNCSSGMIAAKPVFWGFPLLPDHGVINFQNCPIGYCCPSKNISCPYDNKHYLSNGCSGNRTGFLCGKCKRGFTETLFSPQCRANDFCTDYWFWPVAMLYSLAFALFLLWKNPITRLIKRLLPWGKLAPDGHPGSDSSSKGGGYIKVLFYFYQVANLVFVSEDIELHLAYSYLLTPIIGWFDFKAISSNDGLVCPFRGLTVPSKIFLHASQVFAVLLGVLVIFPLHGAFRKFRKQSPAVPSSGQYFRATTECLLLGYSALACAALKTLNCVEIQSTHRFFYDANIQCWQWWQKMSGVFLAVYIIPFVFVLYLGSSLRNGKVISTKQFLCACVVPLPFAVLWLVTCKKGSLNITESQRVNDELSPLLTRSLSTGAEHDSHDLTDDVVYGPFRKSNDAQGPGTVYWESVFIGRRLVLICLHTFIVFPFVRMVCLSVTCAAILVHHTWKKPFKDPRVNRAETASLTALLVLAVINMAEATLGMNGELLSEQKRVCMTVLHVVEIIILGTVPVIFLVVILISVAWQLIKFCQYCLAAPYKLLVN